MKRWLMAFVGLLLALPAWADYQAGVEAYEEGDYETALREWLPLAERGDAGAQYQVGVMYDFGQGVAQDYGEAVRWLRLAAEQGLARAQTNLGIRYDAGQVGVAQDHGEAARWYRLAAEQGFAEAQYHLGQSYAKGQGLSQDHIMAHMWFDLAAAQGADDAGPARDRIAAEMTPEQVAEAQRLAREWEPRQ